MSRILFDLSGKIDHLTVAALSAVKSIADSCDSPFFVVGASARDFILKHCYGIEPSRLTTDIDLGVKVADWAHFHKLTDALKATGKFLPDERQKQRYHFESVLIDIVPFGVSAGLKGDHFGRNKSLPSLEKKICEDAVQTL
jgi:predicted nucleotidyltransferase